jgi:hypothetical protein
VVPPGLGVVERGQVTFLKGAGDREGGRKKGREGGEEGGREERREGGRGGGGDMRAEKKRRCAIFGGGPRLKKPFPPSLPAFLPPSLPPSPPTARSMTWM